VELPVHTLVLLVLSGVGFFASTVEAIFAWYLTRKRHRPEPERWPSFSILKPLAGHDDDLEENLASHVALDYPGEWEILLGVRSAEDTAYPLAKAFAEKHPERVRLVLQEGEPGLNPKVNQLITLTRHARHEVIALTDSNVRVKPWWATEHAKYLARAKVGLTSNSFVGEGETTLGSAFDNSTLNSFAFPNIATADVMLRVTQIVAKSVAIKREVLEQVGGWEAFKDLLAEDQRLGRALVAAGYRTALCSTPVLNVARTARFGYFWKRHSRWAMIRFKVLPGVWLEPMLNTTLFPLLVALTNPWWPGAWAVAGAGALFSIVFTQVVTVLGRGHGMSLKWLWLMPLRDLAFFGCWVRGFFLSEVDWRGNRFKVGAETRLTALSEGVADPSGQKFEGRPNSL